MNSSSPEVPQQFTSNVKGLSVSEDECTDPCFKVTRPFSVFVLSEYVRI
jgi:hypothetical protein